VRTAVLLKARASSQDILANAMLDRNPIAA
jgi:hypothetical protein